MVDQLYCSKEQADEIRQYYETGDAIDREFNLNGAAEACPSQIEAEKLLALHGLGQAAREDLESRWKTHWTRNWGKKSKEKTRVLLQWFVYLFFLI